MTTSHDVIAAILAGSVARDPERDASDILDALMDSGDVLDKADYDD